MAHITSSGGSVAAGPGGGAPYVPVAGTYATAATLVESQSVTGDTNPRMTIGADGKLSWGPGNGAVDTALARSASGGITANAPAAGTPDILTLQSGGTTQYRLAYLSGVWAWQNLASGTFAVNAFNNSVGMVVNQTSGSGDLFDAQANGVNAFRILNGGGLCVKEGANAKQGTAALVAGTVTVANTSVTANSRILLTSQVDGGTPGFLRVSARTAGTSFTITSSSGTDLSTFAYQIFEPA